MLIMDDLVKRLIKEWDPDFTKVTPEEVKIIDKSDREMKSGEYYSEKEVW